MVTPTRSSRGGWTVFEALLTLVLTGAVLAGLVSSLRRSVAVYESATGELELERRFERTLSTLRREFANADPDTLNPVPVPVPGGPPPWTDQIEFRSITGWNAGAPTTGGLVRLATRLEAGETLDGTDEDGDGLVDELELVLTRDADTAEPRGVVLVRGVLPMFPGETDDGTDENGNGWIDEPGFALVIEGNSLIVRLATGENRPSSTLRTRARDFRIVLSN